MRKRYCGTDERNKDLYDAYRDVISNTCGSVSLEEILKRTVRHPARKFYISVRRASDLVGAVERGDEIKVSPERRRMIDDIIIRVNHERDKYPDKCLRFILEEVIDSPAPEFYLKPTSANIILHHEKKRRKERFKKDPKEYFRH